jgi:lactoylglutathione lyase
MQSQLMSHRFELFVRDMEVSAKFYCTVLGFTIQRQEHDYTSLTSGTIVLGLGPVGKLPERDGYFSQQKMQRSPGVGVEIVFEADDIEGFYRQVLASHYPVLEPLMARPWGLTDFRLADPDGYYLRVTSRA